MTCQTLILLACALLPFLGFLLAWFWAHWLGRDGGFTGAPGRFHGWASQFNGDRWLTTSNDVAALGSPTLVTGFSIGFCLLLLSLGHWWSAVLQGLASALAATLGTVLKRLTDRRRPDAAAAIYFGTSFPSSHTLMATACYGAAVALAAHHALWPGPQWLLIALALAVALFVGASRVVLRVHYLSDVAAGWLVGGCITAAVAVAVHVGKSCAHHPGSMFG